MSESMFSENVITAFSKGYYIDEYGNCFYKNRKRKLQLGSNGYYRFNIRNGSEIICVLPHKMQAYDKFGKEAFKNDIVVRHLNGNPLDNSIKNILIGTQKQNMLDVPKAKRILNASNQKFNHSEIIKDYKSGLKYSEIMKKHAVSSKSTISFIIRKSLKSKIVA